MLISLLIKYICRYLPYASKEMENRDLFQTIQEKNSYLQDNIKKELDELSKNWGIQLKNTIDFTKRIVSIIKSEHNKVKQKANESIISESSNLNEESEGNVAIESEDDDSERDL